MTHPARPPQVVRIDDGQLDNLADRIQTIVKKNDNNLLDLYGPAQESFSRILQALAGFQNTDGVTVGFDRVIQLGALVIDGTQAPFRVNGKRWSCGFNVGAAASSNVVQVQNRPSGQPKDGLALVTVEEIRYQGPSVAGVDVFGQASFSEIAVGAVLDVETAMKIDPAGSPARKFALQEIGAQATTGGGPASQVAFLANVAVGNPPDVYRPESMVLWPGEFLDVRQVALVAMTLTVSGRLWKFSKAIK